MLLVLDMSDGSFDISNVKVRKEYPFDGGNSTMPHRKNFDLREPV